GPRGRVNLLGAPPDSLLRSSPRGAPRDARVAGASLRGPSRSLAWIPAFAGMSGLCAPPIETETRGGSARSATDFTTAGRELHKRKAAGWGPGGSRTSAIVSGGWGCGRRRLARYVVSTGAVRQGVPYPSRPHRCGADPTGAFHRLRVRGTRPGSVRSRD